MITTPSQQTRTQTTMPLLVCHESFPSTGETLYGLSHGIGTPFWWHPAPNWGQSTMSQSDVKADENAYIPCISILFGRFSEECEQVLPSNKSTCPNHEQREECAWANRSTSGVSAWNVVNRPLTPVQHRGHEIGQCHGPSD